MSIQQIIRDIKRGIPVIVVDDYSRENEGDFVLSAEKTTYKNLLFIKNYGGGLICVPTSGEILDKLKIPMMVKKSTDPLGTPFTITVDITNGTTGMSIHDKLCTIKTIANAKSKPSDLSRPGHIFPLRPKADLLKKRKGHTEASIELMKLAGLREVAVIIEIMNIDGTMARMDDLKKLKNRHSVKIISVEEIYSHVYNAGV
jgi:3,4-dihydroxy 2-butanone 4-phosphate synthase / GTP cyclohydrolase II